MSATLVNATSAGQAAWLGGQQQRWRQRQRRHPQQQPSGQRQRLHGAVCSQGMNVPSDSFGGVSPERKAAQPLQAFFTFCAAKIVLDQLRGIGRPDLGAYNAAGATVLRRFMEQESMRDSEAWLARLMGEDELLGVRIMEVRAAYAKEDFEWNNLRRLAVEGLEEGNTRLLRQHASQRFGAMMDQAGGGEPAPER